MDSNLFVFFIFLDFSWHVFQDFIRPLQFLFIKLFISLENNKMRYPSMNSNKLITKTIIHNSSDFTFYCAFSFCFVLAEEVSEIVTALHWGSINNYQLEFGLFLTSNCPDAFIIYCRLLYWNHQCLVFLRSLIDWLLAHKNQFFIVLA